MEDGISAKEIGARQIKASKFVNLLYDPGFKRVMYYASGVYRNNLDESEDYDKLTPVYVVGVLNYSLQHENERLWDSDNLISHYEMVEKRTGELAPTVFSCNFAELSRFRKPAEECTTYRDQLFYWFKHSGELELLPDVIQRSPRMVELAKACEKGSFTPEKKMEYERLMMNELDTKNRIYQAERRARAEALVEGRKEGRKEGLSEGKLEDAKNMKADGMSNELICKYTGLSLDIVGAL